MSDFEDEARQWVESTWRSDFRYGVITYHPHRHDPDHPLSRRELRQMMADENKFCGFVNRVIAGLQSGELDAQQSRELVARDGLEGRIFISGTKEELIGSIVAVFMRGADCWDNGDELAWDEDGMFCANFWHDQ